MVKKRAEKIREGLQRAAERLADEVIRQEVEALSDDDVDQELRDRNIDPEAVVRRLKRRLEDTKE